MKFFMFVINTIIPAFFFIAAVVLAFAIGFKMGGILKRQELEKNDNKIIYCKDIKVSVKKGCNDR